MPAGKYLEPDGISNAGVANERQHILLLSVQYTKNKTYAQELSTRLQELGYDIWRENERSQLIPALSQAQPEILTRAFQNAHSAIALISPEWKDNILFRSELEYLRSSFPQVKIAFVTVQKEMQQSDCKADVPKIASVTAWFRKLSHQELAPPLLDPMMVETTAEALASLLGSYGRRTFPLPLSTPNTASSGQFRLGSCSTFSFETKERDEPILPLLTAKAIQKPVSRNLVGNQLL